MVFMDTHAFVYIHSYDRYRQDAHRMFCADYVASFVVHAAIVLGMNELDALYSDRSDLGTGIGWRTIGLWKEDGVSLSPIATGAFAGFAGAAAVFPFDFVRKSLVPGKSVYISSLSTVPYASVYFGVYFSNRDPRRKRSQCVWAAAAATAAMLCEMPFDKAKRSMFSSRAMHVGTNLLYVPFAAMMLLMYDEAIKRRVGFSESAERS